MVLSSAWLAWWAPAPAAAQLNRNAEASVFFEQGNQRLARAMRARGARREVLLQQALDSYVESLRIVRSRNAVFNAGLTLEELGRLDEAFGYYIEYLRMPGLSEEERVEGQRRLDALRPRVAVVAVESEPPGAQVWVDRPDLAPRGVTPLEVALPAGEHTFFLSLDGYVSAQATAAASVGERAVVRQTLEPEPVPVVIRAPAGGRLTVNGEPVDPGQEIRVVPGRYTIRYEPAVERVIEVAPGSEPMIVELDVPDRPQGRGALGIVADRPAQVSVDGTVVGAGREVRANVGAGRHVVEVRAEGYATARSEVDVQPGEQLRLEVHMERSTAGESTLGELPVLAWAATGLVGATAVGFSIHAILVNGDFEEAHERGQPNEDLYRDVQDANRLADYFWIATAAAGATAVVLTLLDSPVAQRPSTIQVAGAPLPDGGMVVAELPWRTP